MLKAHVDQHQVIAGGSANLSLENATTLTAPSGVSFPANPAMARWAHTRTRVVLYNLIGRDHPTAQDMQAANKELLEW